jgi:nucleoside-diphosphate-sugar epimerase
LLPVNTPLSPYAATKKSAESLAWTWHHLHNLDVSVLRYFTVYGEAGRPDMSYFRFIHQIENELPLELFGDGSQARDFTHVADIARGTIKAMQPVGYEVFNLGDSDPVTVSALIATIEDLTGKQARIQRRPFHNADMLATWANIDKAREQLDWEPTIGLTEGLQRCVNWYRSNQELAERAFASFSFGENERTIPMTPTAVAAAA